MSDPKILHRQSGGQIAEAFERLQGPFAFPQMVQLGDRALVEGGLTIRDWFAGQALAGCMAAEAPDVIYEDQGVASRAYRIADAMLAEREKGGAA